MQTLHAVFFDIGLMEIILVLSITLFAGLVKGLVGFAMPLIMITGFATFLSLELSIVAMIIPTLFTNFYQAFREGIKPAVISIKTFWKYLTILLIMIVIGSNFITILPAKILFLLMGTSIFVFTLFQFFRSELNCKNNNLIELGFGFFAGFFGGLTGTWGPPTVAYFLTLKLEKNFQIRSQGIIYFFGSIIFIFAHIHSNIINLASITFSFFLLLPAIVGVLLGNYIGTKIDGKKFTKVTQLLLLIASLNLIRRGFGF